jgi:hypothetical protein
VKVARPPPVPSSGFLPLSTVLAALAARTRPLRSSPFAVAPRRFAALFHAARALGIALQSFPFSRSRTRSRGPPASLWVRVRPPNGATVSMGFAAPFPVALTSGHGSPRGLTGLGGWDDGSLEPLDIVRDTQARPGTSLLGSVGLAGLGGRHAHFEALLPSRVRSRDERHPGQGTFVWSVLSWVSYFPFRAFSSISRARHARERSCSGWALASTVLGSSTPGIAFCQVRSPTVGPRTHGPLTCSVDRTLHVAVRQRPCSRSPSRWLSRAGRQSRPTSFRRAFRLPGGSPVARLSETCYPRPLSAAPHASLVLRPRSATGAGTGWTSETLVLVLPVGRSLARLASSCEVLPLFEDSRVCGLNVGAWLIRPSGFTPTGGSPRGGRSVAGTPLAPLVAVPSSSRPESFRPPSSLTSRSRVGGRTRRKL